MVNSTCALFGDANTMASTEVTSALAAPLLFVRPWAPPVGQAVWLGGLWLAVALAERSRAWFTAFQAALTAAALFAAARWLQGQEWVGDGSIPFADPRSLQDLITVTIAPHTWLMPGGGGGTGSIHVFDGLLVINHTPEVHKQIADLLMMIRAAAAQDHGPAGH